MASERKSIDIWAWLSNIRDVADMPPQPVPPEQQASYSAIIDEILASSDLNVISAKQIRKGLQEKVEYDITPQKVGIHSHTCCVVQWNRRY